VDLASTRLEHFFVIFCRPRQSRQRCADSLTPLAANPPFHCHIHMQRSLHFTGSSRQLRPPMKLVKHMYDHFSLEQGSTLKINNNNAYETRDSFSLISYASCLGVCTVMWVKIHSKCALQPDIAKNSLKPLILDFTVVQDHRCWYPRKGRQQCLL